jgi:phosphomannomutase
MKINSGIFKFYDVRGEYPEQINGETAYKIGRAFVSFLDKTNPKIIIGRDCRLSSPELFKNFAKGAVDGGGEVTEIGLSTTPMLYWANAFFGYDGGVEVTASHNPGKYNGFKFVKAGSIPVSGDSGLKKIKEIAEKLDCFSDKRELLINHKEVLKDYLEFNCKDFDFGSFEDYKIIIDTANSVSGLVIRELAKKNSFKIHFLFDNMDGSFPGHDPDPLVEKNLDYIKKEILARKADFGLAFDGDGDRMVFVDEKGISVSGDLMVALMAEWLLKEKPGAKILYDIRSSNIVRETILANSGQPVLSRVGHSPIKEKMRKENILFGGELSSHFYYKNNYFCEDPLFVFFKVLEIMSKTGKTFSELINPLRKYFHSGEINLKVSDGKEKMEKTKVRYKDGKILEIDGLRVDFPDWWFLLRLSNTEPILRLIIEARNKELLEEKKEELLALLSD